MNVRRMKIANLDEAEVERIRQMEEQLGTLILALEPHYPPAELTSEQLDRLRALEQELGVVLIAYRVTGR
jgi:hypothetical protein